MCCIVLQTTPNHIVIAFQCTEGREMSGEIQLNLVTVNNLHALK